MAMILATVFDGSLYYCMVLVANLCYAQKLCDPEILWYHSLPSTLKSNFWFWEGEWWLQSELGV